jgi:hypothetical protein
MSVKVDTTTITFNDSTVQSTAGAFGNTATYFYATVPGTYTWTKPANLKFIKLTMYGAGGGGGGSTTTVGSFGGHGGYGGMAQYWIPAALLPSSPVPITCGPGGAGGSSGGGVGGVGSSTLFNTVLSAQGGSGGTINPANEGVTGASGGSSVSVSSNQPTFALGITMPGEVSVAYGTFGNYGPSSGGVGSSGTGYGSGGGGGVTGPGGVAYAGGAGVGGFAFIEEYY